MNKVIIKRIKLFKKIISSFFSQKIFSRQKRELGFCGKKVILGKPIIITKPKNVYIYDNSHIFGYSKILIVSAKFLMKENSGAAQGFSVITGNHTPKLGFLFKENILIDDIEKDVVVEEDVSIAANVTLLAGVNIGRGAIIGSGSVCRKNVPPYSIVIGNPAKIVGFKFTPEEIIEHEMLLYPENKRLEIEQLNKNYEKYFLKKLKDIKYFIS